MLNDGDTNADLPDYRGYVELELKFGKADGFVLGSNLRFAPQGASVLLDFTYPLHRLFSDKVNTYFHLQYVNALAERLIAYQERSEAWRLGFSIVR